jgi:hypothetical protein
MIERVKRLGDFIVLIFISICFFAIFSEGSEVTEWSAAEWMMFGSMVWAFIRFALELKEYCTEKLIEKIEERLKSK